MLVARIAGYQIQRGVGGVWIPGTVFIILRRLFEGNNPENGRSRLNFGCEPRVFPAAPDPIRSVPSPIIIVFLAIEVASYGYFPSVIYSTSYTNMPYQIIALLLIQNPALYPPLPVFCFEN